MDFLSHLRSDSSRFAEVLGDVDADARVPCCPDWSASDLLWHLIDVQWFWGSVVAQRLTEPEAAEIDKPGRPVGRQPLLDLFETASSRLQEALMSTPPETHVWTWHADDQTAGFVRRRQAHEAFIHRVDAEMTAGLSSSVAPALAVDGIDEILTVMMSGVPEWATFEPDGVSIRLGATDSDRHWGLALGRMRGTSPVSGNTYDRDAATVGLDAPAAAATITGMAGDLDRWLWGRAALDRVDVDGDPSLAIRIRQLAEESTQ